MKASEIQEGDQFKGNSPYTVEKVLSVGNGVVEVLVRFYVDGGTGVRVFDQEQDVPLVRQSEEKS
jgi:hypothetical protein